MVSSIVNTCSGIWGFGKSVVKVAASAVKDTAEGILIGLNVITPTSQYKDTLKLKEMDKCTETRIKKYIVKQLESMGKDYPEVVFGKDCSKLHLRIDIRASQIMNLSTGEVVITLSNDMYRKIRKSKKINDACKFVIMHEVGHTVFKHGSKFLSYQKNEIRKALISMIACGLINGYRSRTNLIGSVVKHIAMGAACYLVKDDLLRPVQLLHDQEYDADRFAVRMLFGDKEGLIFFEKVRQQNLTQGLKFCRPGNISQQGHTLASNSHPSNVDRIKRISELGAFWGNFKHSDRPNLDIGFRKYLDKVRIGKAK